MYIIVGLGNPKAQYAATRHNIGFDAVKRIAEDNNISMDFNKHKAICGKGYIQGEKVILAMPQTFMNLSGESVRELVDYYKVDLDEIIVIYDDISLDVGKLRIRPRGSAGGHNGMKNIIQHLGCQEFPRIRIGVGDKPRGWDLADYVLSRFPKEEEALVQDGLSEASKACEMMITDGIEAAMNQFNRAKK